MQNERVLKIGTQYRSFAVAKSDIDEEKRTVSLAFSSETPVERYYGYEILDHSRGAADLRRLKRGGALLIEHDAQNQVGVIEEVTIDEADRKGRALVRFGRSAKATEIFQDVLDGIRSNVSVGYLPIEMALEREGKDTPSTYRVMRWEPLEISIVSMPADINTGIGRTGEEQIREIRVTMPEKENTKGGKNMVEQAVVAVDIDKVRTEAREAEQIRTADILALGEKHGCRELARRAVADGGTVDSFKEAVLETVYAASKVPGIASPIIGMSEADKREYSIVRAMRQIAETGRLSGLEKEASEATAKVVRREAKGFFIPQDVMTRTMGVMDSTKGGYTVGQVVSGDLIELLRNKALVAQLGAISMTGLVGNVAIPRVTGGATAYWLPETGQVDATDQAFGQLGLVPHRLVGDTAYSKELLMQSSIDVEMFIRGDLVRVLTIEKDRACITGSGASGQPLGIMNTSGIGSVSFGGAPTWAKVVEFETKLADANADAGSIAYLTTPAVRGKWKSTPKVSAQALFLWEGGTGGTGIANGYRAEATKQVPNDKVIMGNWNDFIIADWAGIDVVVDPYSLKKQGLIETTVTLWTDCGIRHAASFVVSTDSGAQ
ncbi:MAG TPA: phage major capsid protein [Dissulfurispiraceae bacterium]|nr:phage major capsid protein [Dissulfurispiraceae bacterium]